MAVGPDSPSVLTKERDLPKITPNLWFDTEGEDAATFYCSVFPNSQITHVTHDGDAGPRPAALC